MSFAMGGFKKLAHFLLQLTPVKNDEKATKTQSPTQEMTRILDTVAAALIG